MSVLAVIPARYGSTRLPAKPLLRDTGKFLIQHVYERVQAARRIDQVVVATDHEAIAEAVRIFGGQVQMTSPDCPSGTDRVAEVARNLPGPDDQIILNVQGDEPELEPDILDRLVQRLAGETRCRMATLAAPFPPQVDPADPNRVKVVLNQRREALYFSRALIPYAREAPQPGRDPAACLLHLGVYAYRRAFLLEYSGWEATRLERLEKLEQLRALEHGEPIAVEIVQQALQGVDTPEDYRAFVQRAARHERP